MRNRPLGKTGIEVSELSLGTWGLAGDAYGPVADGEADRVIDRALELGITLFETADVYGRGAMEKKLGQRLPASARVCTKVGTYLDAKPPQKRFTARNLEVAFHKCQERLQRNTIDVLLLHNPSMVAMGAGDAERLLVDLKANGNVRAWGVSAGSVEVARSAISRGADVIELAYNVLFAGDLHELAGDLSASGVAVLARSVLAHGLLTGHWSAEREFLPPDHRADRRKPEELRRRIEQLDVLRPAVTGAVTSLRAAALRFALSNQLVSSAVLGPRSVAQLEQLVRDAGDGPPYLRDTVLAELSNRMKGAGLLP